MRVTSGSRRSRVLVVCLYNAPIEPVMCPSSAVDGPRGTLSTGSIQYVRFTEVYPNEESMRVSDVYSCIRGGADAAVYPCPMAIEL